MIDLARLFVKQNREIQKLEQSKADTDPVQDDYRLAARAADNQIGHDQLPEEP